MIALVFAVLAYFGAFFIGRHRLAMEVAALRHQLVVFKRKQRRPRLCSCDRTFWGAPRFVAGLGERTDHGETGYRRVLAPCWISAILATAIPSSTPRPAEGPPRGSATDSAHEVLQPILERASHPRRTTTTWIRCFGTHCVALFARTAAPARQLQGAALAGIRPESPRGDGGLRFLYCAPLSFRVLYCFFLIEHDRRRILHFNTTAHPTSEWIVQQLREALPLPCLYRYVIFDRDRKFSTEVCTFLKASGIKRVRMSVRQSVAKRSCGTMGGQHTP
jgi:hypothetical protein